MNQFNSIDFKGNKQALSIAKDFDYILNNLWSTYSEYKGRRRWNEVSKDIPSDFHRKILTEIGHVESGHGREQALMAVKSEMVKYLHYLIK
jgi:hypothetical protein